MPPEATSRGCRFAHLTDLHLTDLSAAPRAALRGKRLLGYLSWRRKRRHEHRRDILDAVVTHLRRAAPQQVVISGDLTHIGLPMEFREAADWLAALGPAEGVCVVPGNHELCARGGVREGLDRWSGYLLGDGGGTSAAPAFPSMRVRAGVAFIGVSTAVVTPALLASGHVGATQRARLAACLDEAAARGLFRVVYLHHGPLPGTDSWRKQLRDGPEVAEVLRRHGVELVLHGHRHRSLRQHLDTAHGEAAVLGTASGSAAGRYGGEVAGYRAFEVQPSGSGWCLREQRFAYDPARGSVAAATPASETLVSRAHGAPVSR